MGGDTLKDKTTVDELTCLELARMYDTEDVTVPWDWRKAAQEEHQQQKEESGQKKESEGKEGGSGV